MPTVITSPRLPEGTDVTAHLLSNVDHLRRLNQPPTPGITAAGTGTMDGANSVSIADLTPDAEYALHGTVNSENVWVIFTGQTV